MNFIGLIIGICSFLVIGIFHPIVIKCEYYFSARCWPVFLVVGIICVLASMFINNSIVSCIIAVFGFSAFWSIGELKEQEQRVAKGWFPANPKRTGK
ncbi:MAG: DUF4491 family protein [Bacillota bacterium]|jgi:hypothetical protein